MIRKDPLVSVIIPMYYAEKYIKQALNEKNCFSLKDLAVNGNDLKEFGIPEGPYLGKILKKLLDFVLENPNKNNKEFLLKKVKLDLSNLYNAESPFPDIKDMDRTDVADKIIFETAKEYFEKRS